MNLGRVIGVVCVVAVVLLVLGCSEEQKNEGELVIVGEQVDNDVDVGVVNMDDGLDSALAELEELEGE